MSWKQVSRFEVEKRTWPGGLAESVEVAATWDVLPKLWQVMREAALLEMDTVMGHISHVYEDGASLYVISSGQKSSDDEALASYTKHWQNLTEAALGVGAVICHHHSVGLERMAWLSSGIGPHGHDILRGIKHLLDPAGIMNPGKLGFAN